jgi:prepilin-type N-terminal cleavage/methylation domain-containing protein
MIDVKNVKTGKEVRTTGRAGFTLIEILIVVAILGIMSGLAVPSMVKFVNNQRLQAAARSVWSDIQTAKMTAIKENRSVTVTRASSDQYGYTFIDGFGNSRSFSRKISDDYSGVTIAFTGGTSITFLGTGMGQTGTNIVVAVSNSAGSRSFPVTWTGKIGEVVTP